MTESYSAAVSTARDYYNSSDADNFYFTIWGGEDIHIGLYDHPEEPIVDASRRTVQQMASLLEELGETSRVLDIGSGFGGAARYLAKNFGCRVVALNLSETENDRNRKMNREQGLDHLIEVVDASFEAIPSPVDSFDVVWSQDAILHSGDRSKVLEEVARVLKPGGRFVFTDPMMADDCPKGVLKPILDRIHLEDLGSPGFYRQKAKQLGMTEEAWQGHHELVATHYGRVLRETEEREEELAAVVSPDYIDRMKKGLQHWVDGGNNGHLSWGIFCFRKQ
ncbi:MAG: methyltransferase domain-containing protein [Desulfuromusa sp.]|jgi:sarcosine/dimethylglycine N-methyltransferase|nr:methyltransferase domain-containing protein [Desulfuromusa sp.]